ncbi:hypothetical protein LXA43DRAFT_1149321, partial [Ganoderma leucocontextum]
MAAYLETPSRVWRRIQADQDQDMPSLPSLPAFEDSVAPTESDHESSQDDMQIASPIHSTPHVLSHIASTVRAPSSTSSTARFAHSLVSRSSKSSLSVSRGLSATGRMSVGHTEDSFDVSSIPSMPIRRDDSEELDIRSSDQDTHSSVPEDYLPPPIEDIVDADLDLSDALQSISRSNSPGLDDRDNGETPRRKSDYDYSMSLRSEPKASPFDKLRNISFRRPLSRNRARTPSLTRTVSSPSSSMSNSTPHSTRSFRYQRQESDPPLAALTVPLPRSATASPAILPQPEERDLTQMNLSSGFPSSIHNNRLDFEQPDENDTELLPEVAAERQRELEESQASRASDSREPTFSSEEALSGDHLSPGAGSRRARSPTPLSVAFSSPQSALFTPTPAFQPRPRARFGMPASSTTPALSSTTPSQHTQVGYGGDPATPATAHKRSFLLSVINSTARPRLRHPTPYNRPESSDESQSELQFESQTQMTPGVGIGAAVNIRNAFAGVTPRPAIHTAAARRRLSSPGIGSGALTANNNTNGNTDSENEQASFVSTASSHDLAVHARANASFDPVIGLGERGTGVGRFNAGKLNNYLHGLNRRLQEENEMLVTRLRTLEEKGGGGANEGTSRRVSGGRRVSTGPALGLGDLAEDAAEEWLEEKAAMEEMVEELKEELETASADKAKTEDVLQAERAERARDKERWHDRMSEVQKGVEGIVSDLERRLNEAEEALKRTEEQKTEAVKDVERRLAVVLVEKDVLAERIKKAEGALENGRDLGAELNAANERFAEAEGELRNAQRQIGELEEEVMRGHRQLDDAEDNLGAERRRTAALEEELDSKMEELTDAVHACEELEEEVRKTRTQLRQAEDAVAQDETDALADNARIKELEQQLAAARESINDLGTELDEEQQENDRMINDSEKAAELARQMEDALEAAEKKMLEDEQEVATLKATISSLERAVEKQQERSLFQAGPSQSAVARDMHAEIEALETEVDDANKEIARLRTMIAQSPARRAIDRAKNARIELLEKEKEDLLERLKSTRNQSGTFGTPVRLANGSGVSPLHRQLLNMSLKSPKTPGGPLKDLSWLQNSMQDPSVAPLVVELARLHQELDRANASIDDKLDRLEDAGIGVVDLTKQLEDARAEVVGLEDELARMSRREDRRIRRLQRVRCQKCRTKIDMRGLDSTGDADQSSILEASTMSMSLGEPPTPPSRTSEALRSELHEVNGQLDDMRHAWEAERGKLLGENAVLHDAATRLNAEVRDAKDEIRKYASAERAGERARAGIQEELGRAKRTMEELEAELKAERSHLRALTSEQTKARREKEAVRLDLRRTESDMTDVRQQLQQIKQDNHDLEKELRSNSNAEQKARLLESKVAENLENINQLRQERSMLAADHKELQRRYTKAAEEVTRLKGEFVASQTSHDTRRHELDLRTLEIDDLRRALSSQASELERAEAERARLAAEKGDVARTVAALEGDLRRVRRDAEAFGRDLKALRAQKDRMEEERREERAKAERGQKQAQAQIRVLREELDGQKEKVREAREEWRGHVCAADDRQLVSLKQQHNRECKGLMVQIKYLKAKYTREATFRCDLGYQKQYLLVLMARLERSEEKILAAVARIGFPVISSNPAPKKGRTKTLRSVAYIVLFLNRTRYV